MRVLYVDFMVFCMSDLHPLRNMVDVHLGQCTMQSPVWVFLPMDGAGLVSSPCQQDFEQSISLQTPKDFCPSIRETYFVLRDQTTNTHVYSLLLTRELR